MKTKFLIVVLLQTFVVTLFLNCNSDTNDLPNEIEDGAEPDIEDGSSTGDTEGEIIELIANDLSAHPMQNLEKPEYLNTVTDPSFGTTIRRITDAGDGNVIKPMYSTIQAWNADETYLILYNQSDGIHQLLNGMDYTFIRNLDDIRPDDIEQIYWDFDDPDIFFYVDAISSDFIKYELSTKTKSAIVNLRTIAACNGDISSGNDVQMMSWNSDTIGFRCDNNKAFSYNISTKSLVEFELDDVNFLAPMPSASGDFFYHNKNVYNSNGTFSVALNEKKTEHSCLGKLAGGQDAYFTVAFDAGPQGGCAGNIIAHELETGACFPIISEQLGYDYAKSGTHISAVAHKNPGWIAASFVGFEKDGQKLLDQELIVARVQKGDIKIYRIGHHRADVDEFGYWGEPHAVISPSGTRVLFGSDWSGTEDGKSVDSYVVELPNFER